MGNKSPRIPLEGINGGLDGAILVGKKAGYIYVDKKRQGDSPVNFKYDVLLPGNCMSQLTVTIEGSTDRLSAITEQDIADACLNLEFIFVRFNNCMVSIYAIDGLKMSAKADSIELIKTSK